MNSLIGQLVFDGEYTLCHICGKWYKALACHVWRTHEWTPDEYREEYGLNKSQPLCSPELSERYANRPQSQDISRLTPWQKGHPLFRKDFRVRRQALISNSECRKNRNLTEKELESMKRNLDKAKRIVPCSFCGVPTIAWKGRVEKWSCRKCRHLRIAETQRLRRRHRIANHLCVDCGVPLNTNLCRCPKHLELRRSSGIYGKENKADIPERTWR